MKAIGKLPRTKKLHVLSNEAGDHKHEEDQGAVKYSPEVRKKKSASKKSAITDLNNVHFEDQKVDVQELTDLDKLYLALAETGGDFHFNALYYCLGITSLGALRDYNIKPDKKILTSGELDSIKQKISNKHFDFQQLAQKFKRSDVVETCTTKGIPVIPKENVTVSKIMTWGPYVGFVCEAQWTKPNGMKEKVCLRYGTTGDQLFLHEAEMAAVLHHKNVLALHGVIIATSFSPSVALVVEFAEYGNLHESSEQRSVERLCRFTIQAATALEHLEANKVIHTSVKSFNCLLVAKDQMRLAGLGACHFESEMKKKSPGAYSQKEVVYQFGKLFSAYFTRYEELTPQTEIAKNIKSCGVYGPLCPSHFRDVFDRCLVVNPDARPSFSEIRQSLVAQKYPSKVRVTSSFSAESAEFISCKTGEVITLIAKDRHKKDKTAWLGETQHQNNQKIGFFKSKHVEEISGYDIMNDSSLPPEIRARGPAAERAFQKAMQNGKVKVYRGRIMLLGQDRAGKTSLKKSLLGMPFNPQEESTVGVEVDPSKCEVEVDQVKNWEPIATERKKLEVSEFGKDIAMLIAKDLNETEAEEKAIGTAESPLDDDQDKSDKVDADSENPSQLFPIQAESKPGTSQNAGDAEIDTPSNSVAEEQSNTEPEIQLNIDTNATLPNDVTELVVQYLQSLKLEDDIKAKEVIVTLWDFAGQHLYYASHPVFLSERAVYVLVHNLSKNLMAEAEPCVRQGIHDIVLDNPNRETNLDNLLSWLVSIHSIRSTDGEANRDLKNLQAKLTYLRPPVFIVGTNADHPFEAAKEMAKCIQKNIAGKTYEKHVIRPFFTVDNTKSQSDEGVKKMRKEIMEVLKEEPYMGEEVPLRWFTFERVVEALVAKKTYHIDLDQLHAIIRQVCPIDDQDEMAAMLNFYHDLGVIVKHGHTVVLEAQWLIDLFKKLITVRPFNETVPLYSDCWEELEENGILRMALVDHVFSDFIEKGLNKQDILDMMELYGLIAKFSCLSSENEDELRYFVPAQLRSSPAGLCELKPSSWDPCPLYVHFLDGFVPHGLFPQLLSRCVVWCSEHGLKQAPQLFNNGARLFIGAQTVFDLNLVCKKRFIKVILKRSNPSSLEPASTSTSRKIAVQVRTFIERTLEGLSRDLLWLRNVRHELSVACAFCAKHSERCSKHSSVCCGHDDCLHLLPVGPEEELICPKNFSNEVIKVCGLDKWLQVQNSQNEEPEVDPSVPDGLDQPLSLKTGSPSSDDLLLVAHELGTSWKMLGRALGLTEAVLEHIEEDERKLFDKCYSVLRNWTQAFGSDATYSCLARALQHPIVGRPRLAVKYCDAHAYVGPHEAVNAKVH